MSGLEFAQAYLNDLLILSTEKGFEKHLEKLELVLTRLQEARLKINAVKSFFAQTNLEYLGYNISREGLRPSQKKVEAILQIKAPTTRKQLRRFIGMVNYYRDMWPLRSHLLSPLSSMTSAKVKWKWTPECQDSFEKMKAIMAKETLGTFPDFTKEFEIHTDASKLQLGACISQCVKPVAFYYSHKLQPAQTCYTTTERELLSIVETLKEFRNILLGQKMRWRLYIEEYSPDLQYIKGTHNVVADALSCLEIKETPFKDTQESFLGLMECFAKKADTDEFHPLNYQQLKNAQDKDKTIQKILKMPNTLYICKDLLPWGRKYNLTGMFQRKDCHSRTTSKACY
jgi:hypothetical protein